MHIILVFLPAPLGPKTIRLFELNISKQSETYRRTSNAESQAVRKVASDRWLAQCDNRVWKALEDDTYQPTMPCLF